MSDNQIISLIEQLHEVKAKEDAIKAKRVALELEIAAAVNIPETWSGSKTLEMGQFKVCFKRNMTQKVDTDKLNELIEAQAVPDEIINKAFRCKYELNKKTWNVLPDAYKEPLSEAITTTPGKIAITTNTIEEEN